MSNVLINPFVFAGVAAGNGPDGTQNYVAVTIQSSEVPTALTDFPVFVDLSDLPAAFWSSVQADGGDIRVTESNGTTRAPVDLVSIDTGGSTGELHFLASSVSASSNTEYRMYYNATSTLSQPAATDTYGRNAVWTDYAAVYHGDDLVDATGNGNTLTAFGNAATGHTANSKIGGAFDLDGTGDYLQATDDPSLDVTGDITMSAWIRSTGNLSDVRRIMSKYDTPSDRSYSFYVSNTDRLSAAFSGDGSSSDLVSRQEANGSITSTTAWYHTVATIDVSEGGTGILLFIDGDQESMGTPSGGSPTSIYAGEGPLTIGDVFASGAALGQEFAGQLDELRIRSGLPPSAAITSEHTNQNTPGTFYAVGSEQAA